MLLSRCRAELPAPTAAHAVLQVWGRAREVWRGAAPMKRGTAKLRATIRRRRFVAAYLANGGNGARAGAGR